MSKAQATGEVKIVASGVQKAAMSIKKGFADIAKDVGRKMKAVAIAGMGSVAAGAAAALKNGFDQKVMLEGSEALMKSLMGGADKAKEAMAMLGAEAKENPMFSKKEMVAAGTQLAGFAKGSAKELKGLVETAQLLKVSNPGATLTDAAIAMKNALAGDYVSLQERFDISPSEIKRLKEAGLEGKKLIDALLKGKGITQQTLVDQSNTMGGQMASMRAAWDEISLQVVEGFWPRIQQTAKEFMEWLGQNKEQIISILTTATEVAIKLFQWVTTGIDYLVRGVQAFGSFLGAWWEHLKANFTAANFLSWLMDMGKAALAAAQGLVYKLLELLFRALKEFAPKVFGWLGGDDLIKDVQVKRDAWSKVAGDSLNRANETMGINAGANASVAEWQRQEEARRNKPPVQETTLQVNVQGHNLPAMMGAS